LVNYQGINSKTKVLNKSFIVRHSNNQIDEVITRNRGRNGCFRKKWFCFYCSTLSKEKELVIFKLLYIAVVKLFQPIQLQNYKTVKPVANY
jgi:hypothetical protein